MKTGTSPWVYQLDKNRKIKRLDRDLETDVTVIGAGIAGVSSAFYLLRNTNHRVVVVEKNRLAHGASGHNAGQVVSYFERPFYDIVEEFGLTMTAEAQAAIENTWELIDQMYTEAGLNIPFTRFMGYYGVSSFEQVLHYLRDNLYREQGGLGTRIMWISHTADFLGKIPKEFKHLYKVVPQRFILERLETNDTSYIACAGETKGCINSALFCQEVMAYLLNKYRGRFAFYEDTSVEKIVLRPDHALIDANIFTIKANKVLLCTNGFEKFQIINENGLELNRRFHKNVTGLVGYMSGYLEKYDKPATAISYFTNSDNEDANSASASLPENGDTYFYLTRRQFDYDGKNSHNLICIGGPEQYLQEPHHYIEDFEYPDEAQAKIDAFVRKTYDVAPNRNIDYKFTWHGLMGYTPNKIRLIGFDPRSQVLLYNLGCNGVGILPSIFGAWRIAEMIDGKGVLPMIFDPKM